LYDAGLNMDFYALGLIFLGISTTVGAVNFIGTIINMRCPGLSLSRLPVFMFGTMTASFSIIFAMPALTVACTFLYLERRFGMHFFASDQGGSAILWQHLFWMFGHPWVYVVVLPAMGMISDIIPVFSRRPLVGYGYVAGATVATGIIGFAVWVHHMFATGMSMGTMSVFSGFSFAIAIPSAIAVAAWIATVWTGRPVFKTPMLFALGFIVLFVIGGVSGVVTAAVPYDWQVSDSYFIVAHIHYVLIGINVFAVMAALYFWLPKITGRMLDEQLGKWNFWTMFIGMNIAFFPMHIAGILGMARRVYTYPAGSGLETPNLITSVGAAIFAIGVLLFLVNFARSIRWGDLAGPNPWDAATLEWSTPSPPPPYNFAVIPTVRSRDPLWEGRVIGEPPRPPSECSSVYSGPVLADGRQTMTTSAIDAALPVPQSMPADSPWPLMLAIAIAVACYGLLFGVMWLVAAGVAAVLISIAAWLWPRAGREPGAGGSDPVTVGAP
jgi:cytochrome c oxidase subunit I+III